MHHERENDKSKLYEQNEQERSQKDTIPPKHDCAENIREHDETSLEATPEDICANNEIRDRIHDDEHDEEVHEWEPDRPTCEHGSYQKEHRQGERRQSSRYRNKSVISL